MILKDQITKLGVNTLVIDYTRKYIFDRAVIDVILQGLTSESSCELSKLADRNQYPSFVSMAEQLASQMNIRFINKLADDGYIFTPGLLRRKIEIIN